MEMVWTVLVQRGASDAAVLSVFRHEADARQFCAGIEAAITAESASLVVKASKGLLGLKLRYCEAPLVESLDQMEDIVSSLSLRAMALDGNIPGGR